MTRKLATSHEMRSVVLVDAVNFTHELKTEERAIITAKINRLREFVEFFFVYKLKGSLIGELGDGFLLLCPPEPHRVLSEAFECMSFVRAYNHSKKKTAVLNTRIAVHYGLIAPPEGGNYMDTNINLTSRLEGVTPPNSICVSSVVRDIVSDTLRHFEFKELTSDLKGFGQSKFYIVTGKSDSIPDPTRNESRLGFYLSTIDTLRTADDWEAVRSTCEQALVDFPSNPEFTFHLAYSSLILDRCSEAIEAFQECVRMNYEVGDALHFIGMAYRDLGDESRAVESFEMCVQAAPDHCHAMVEMGDICFEHRQYAEAWRWAKRATRVAPRFFHPRALEIAIALILGKKLDLTKVVKHVPPRNRVLFRSYIQEYLETARVLKYRRLLDGVFKTIYGSTGRERDSDSSR